MQQRSAPLRHSLAAQALPSICLLLLALTSCQESSSTNGGGGGAAGRNSPTATELEFEPPTPLLLGAGESAALDVRVSPEGFHVIDFTLQSGDWPGFDAYLAEQQSTSDSSGRATTELTAPTAPGVFLVAAETESGLVAERIVTVSSEGFATVEVSPNYAGSRSVGTWVASVHVGVSCADLGSYWDDSLLRAGGAETIVVGGVPVGPKLAVTLRADQAVSGCTGVEGLGAGESLALEVEVVDRPLRVDDGTLQVALDGTEASPGFALLMSEANSQGLALLQNGLADDRELLLTAMQELLPTAQERVEFSQARTDYDFTAALSSVSATQFSGAVSAALVSARNVLLDGVSFHGVLELGAESSAFNLSTVSGIDAGAAGFLVSSGWQVTRAPDDHLVVFGELAFQKVRWLAAIAEAEAGTVGSLPSSVADAADCEGVVELLESAAGGDLISGCDTSCAELLCSEALASLWTRLQTGGADLDSLEVAVTASATASPEARPEAAEGEWLASVRSYVAVEKEKAELTGKFTATLDSPDF